VIIKIQQYIIVIGFFQKYTHGNLKKELAVKKNSIKIKYPNYNWSSNKK